MAKNVIIGLLAVTSLLAGAVAVDRHWKLQAARTELRAQQIVAKVPAKRPVREVPPRAANRPARIKPVPQEPIPGRPSVDVEALTLEIPDTSAEPDQVADPQQPEDPLGGLGELMQGIMQDPGARKMMEQQFRIAVAYEYGPLYEELRLDATKKKHLEELLLAKMMTGLDGSNVMGFEDSQAAEEYSNRQRETQILDEEIEELLGAQGFERYERFSKTTTQRASVNMLQERLRLQGETLSEEKVVQLIDIMYEESEAAKAESASTGAATRGKSLTERIKIMQDRRLKQTRRAQERVLARAAAILSERQLAELRATQAQENRTLELGDKFSEQFLTQFMSRSEPQ